MMIPFSALNLLQEREFAEEKLQATAASEMDLVRNFRKSDTAKNTIAGSTAKTSGLASTDRQNPV